MDTLKKIANAVWSCRQIIEFGNSPQWDEKTFLKEWVDKKECVDNKGPSLWQNKPGWYWIESDITLEELENLNLPQQLPAKAVKFDEVARFNRMRLAPADIYSPQEGQLNVIYSGQEDRIFTRLRTHFSLTMKNTKTGALGISSYPLSNRKWRASFFHEGMIGQVQNLTPEERQNLRELISEKHSRDLVEVCWRIENGWPVLCIK